MAEGGQMAQITTNALKALKRNSKGQLWDDDVSGFGARCQGGTVRFVARARNRANNKPWQRTLGRWGDELQVPDEFTGKIYTHRLDVQGARDLARTWVSKLRDGIDPEAERQQALAPLRQKQQERQHYTVAKVADTWYEATNNDVKPGTLKNRRIYLKKLKEEAGDVALSDLDGRTVADVVLKLHEKSPGGGALSLLSTISTMMDWAVAKGYAKDNPAPLAKRDPDIAKIKPRERERRLSSTELGTVWKATRALHDPYGRAIRFLMLSGLRVSAAFKLEWRWVNFADGRVTFPADTEGMKDVGQFDLPLTNALEAELRVMYDQTGGGRYVFSYNNGVAPIRDQDHVRKMLGDRLPSDWPRWTWHDLSRRTFISWAGDNDIALWAHQAAGHSIGGVAGTYNRSTYFRQKRAALALYANYVRRCADEAPLDPEDGQSYHGQQIGNVVALEGQ
jgi:integrase